MIICKENTINTREPQFLMIFSKYSYSFVDFILGKYSNMEELTELLQEITVPEKQMILQHYDNFKSLWDKILFKKMKMSIFAESKAKFTFFWKWIYDYLSYNFEYKYYITDAGFPKGRKDRKAENDLSCALREMNEETGLTSKKIDIVPGIKFSESYIKNDCNYIHEYYVGILKDPYWQPSQYFTKAQKIEISHCGFHTLTECKNLVRDYSTQRKNILDLVANNFESYKELIQQIKSYESYNKCQTESVP